MVWASAVKLFDYFIYIYIYIYIYIALIG